jgi:hypothetical protein
MNQAKMAGYFAIGGPSRIRYTCRSSLPLLDNFSRNIAVLITLLATLVLVVSTGIRAAADEQRVLEGPSTLELGLIGGGIIVVYAVATRALGRRRARIAGDGIGSQLTVTAPQATAAVETQEEQGPSRGAA